MAAADQLHDNAPRRDPPFDGASDEFYFVAASLSQASRSRFKSGGRQSRSFAPPNITTS